MAVRKRATQMTDTETQRFRDVITTLIQNGTYGQLVSHHANMMHNMHGSMGFVGRQRFLPWHRVYLLRLEEAMQAIDPLSFIPYWRWTTQRSVPSWLQDFRLRSMSLAKAISLSRAILVFLRYFQPLLMSTMFFQRQPLPIL